MEEVKPEANEDVVVSQAVNDGVASGVNSSVEMFSARYGGSNVLFYIILLCVSHIRAESELRPLSREQWSIFIFFYCY